MYTCNTGYIGYKFLKCSLKTVYIYIEIKKKRRIPSQAKQTSLSGRNQKQFLFVCLLPLSVPSGYTFPFLSS